jgi:uncharacterized protein YaeQ
MAPNATIYHFEVALSDVERSVYETLDLRVARHPSETLRYLLLRTFAYCLAFEEGIAFSKGGLSDADEPALSIRDATGILVAWIDVGSPSAERLHRASKAARRVMVFTAAEEHLLRREAASRPIHRLEDIEVFRIAPSLLDAIESKIEKRTKLDLLRNAGELYVTIGADTMSGAIEPVALAAGST